MSGDAAGVLSREAIIGLQAYWKLRKFAYDVSGNIEYIGVNPKFESLEGDGTWGVWKFTYTGTDLTLAEGPLTGSWTGRAALSWTP